MKRELLFLITCCVVFGFQSSANGDVLLYDVNFSSPPHTIGQPPVTGGGPAPRFTPSGIPTIFPGAQVVQSLGALTDQPCKFVASGTHWYAQLTFGLSPDAGGFATVYPRYIFEMDLVIEELVGEYNAFTLFLDTPAVRSIIFNPDGTVVHGSATIGHFQFGQVISLKTDVDLENETWKVWMDGRLIHSGNFYTNTLENYRLSLGNRGGYTNLAAVDNIRIYAVIQNADFNQDNIIDMNDLDILSGQWLNDLCFQSDGCDGTDIDDNNQVDFLDYALLAKDWLETANEAPLVNAGADQRIDLPALSVNIDGAVTDDGRPEILTTVWTKQNGPGTVTFGNAAAIDTSASFSEAGTYILRLAADDGQLVTCDDVKIMINQSPTVDAGRDQIIALSWPYALLEGSVTDDGLPNPPGTMAIHWTVQSGPGEVAFDDANAPFTGATFSEFGTYVLRLTVDDSVFSAYDEVTIQYFEVMPENQPPNVNAGDDSQIFNEWTQLDGTVTDDGLPYPPGEVLVEWTQMSGPMMVPINPPDALNPDVWFPDYGVYVFRLTASDGELNSYDEVTITFQQPGENQAPWVDAGMDQMITTGDAALSGMAFDDGLPSPPHTMTTNWTKEDGPGMVTFADTSDPHTTATFSDYGTYILRLTAGDSELSSYDEVTIVYQQQE